MYRRICEIILVGIALASCSNDPKPSLTQTGGQRPPATIAPQAAPTPQTTEAAKTLGDVVSPSLAAAAPPQGQYYMAIAAMDSSDTPMPPDKCVSQSFWAFVRKWVGIKSSAAVIVTAKITPKGGASPTTVPIYMVNSTEANPTGAGSTCDAEFTNRDITFRYPSSLNPNFDIDIVYNVNEDLNSAAVQNTISAAKQLMTLIGAASGSPAVIVAKLGDPTITSLSTSLDGALSNNWTHVNGLSYHGNLNSGADGSQRADEIDLKFPHVVAGAGGVKVSPEWNASAKIFISYYSEEFKSGGNWSAPPDIMSDPIVAGLPSGQTNLDKLILNGDVTNGFDWKSLVAATNTSSLRTACEHLDNFLASFLIDDDRLAARFAVLRDSPYGDDPTLRQGSGCFSDTEISTTLPSMNAAYVFDDPSRTPRTNSNISDQMDPIAEAIASGNASLIKTLLITDTRKFFITLGSHQSDFYQGDNAIAEFDTLRLSCYQAGQQRNLAVMGSVLTVGQIKETALFTFDDNGLLEHVVVMSPSDAAAALGIDLSTWVDPQAVTCKASTKSTAGTPATPAK